MPDRLTDIKAAHAASPERFDNDRTDPRARPTHQEPSPKPEPKPNPEYSRNDYSEGNDAADKAPEGESRASSACKATDEHGNCYRDACPVHHPG